MAERRKSTKEVTMDKPAAKKPAPKKKPSSHLNDIIMAMGITGFDEKKYGWNGMLNLLQHTVVRLVAAEAVCQSIAMQEPVDSMLKKLQIWANVIRPQPPQSQDSNVEADVAAAVGEV